MCVALIYRPLKNKELYYFRFNKERKLTLKWKQGTQLRCSLKESFQVRPQL